MTAEQVRIGLVGYGFGGRVFHAPLLASAPACDFAGVVTTLGRAPGGAAQEHPDVRAYDSLEALAARGAVAVAISTPAHTHIPLALQAIGLGMAVVCDKPFALERRRARDGDRRGRDRRRGAQRLPEPPLGLRPAHPAAAAHAGPTRRDPALRVGASSGSPPSGTARGRRWHPARLRQPPGRPGAAAVRPGRRPSMPRCAAPQTTSPASSLALQQPAACAPTSAATGARARPRRDCGSAAPRARSSCRRWTARSGT